MRGGWRYAWAVGLSAVVILATTVQAPVARAASTCTATVDPHSYSPFQTQDIHFTVTNTGSSAIHWVQFAPPTLLIEPRGISSAGWAPTTNTYFAELDDGVLPVSSTLDATVTVHTANIDTDPADWRIRASTASDGTNPISCSGDLSGQIAGPLADQTPPVISNVDFETPTDHSVVITWQTDEPADSQVFYATQTDYDPNVGTYNQQSSLDSSLTTDHRLELTGLLADTGYHFAVSSSDASGNNAVSGDATFVTAVQTITNSSSSDSTSSLNLLPPPELVPLVPESQREKIPPTITIATTAKGPVAAPSEFTGTATDNVAIAKLFYSTDGGANWSAITTVKGLGTARATYSFTPVISDEGNYPIQARAMDTSGNLGVSPVITLIIDRLPPIIGNAIFTLGSQVLAPTDQGLITGVVGVDEKITVSAVGGPTDVTVIATDAKGKVLPTTTSLSRSATTGLWSGLVSFKKSGRYQLTVEAMDGAGNERSRNLAAVDVTSPASVFDQNSFPMSGATLTIFTYDVPTKNWVIWDGGPYSQANPQASNSGGNWRYFLPAGEYYERITAAGYQSAVSRIFTLANPVPLTDQITLRALPALTVGRLAIHWPLAGVQVFNHRDVVASNGKANSLIGQELPTFSLTNTTGQTVQPVDLRGRPTVLTFLDSWTPAFSEQIGALAHLQANSDLNVVPISRLESSAKLAHQLQLSGTTLTYLADPDGTTVAAYPIPAVPSHIFVNRRGVVTAVVSGVLSESQLLAMLEKVN